MSNLFDLTGKVAVITGSSRGIGAAIARNMAEHGAKVIISSRTMADCEATAKSINDAYGKGEEIAFPIVCNIAKKEDLQALVDKGAAKWGKIDSLVCNAAINLHYGPMHTIPDDIFDEMMHCNLRSNHWLCHMGAPHLIKQGGGSIIIISSISALRGSDFIGTYGLAKTGEVALARNLAREYGEHNIRVNCILPGLTRTDFAKDILANPTILKRATQGAALKRIGEPDEIAGAAVFLASAAGGFTTGANIVIDGGTVC